MAAFACGLVAVTRLAVAQGRVPHIAYFWLGSAGSDGEILGGLRSGLHDLGYQEGRNLVIDGYYADGDPARLAELAAAAIAEHPDVFVTEGGIATATVAKLTQTIPIVSVNGDPVGLGFAASLAHPGGNITGLSIEASYELAGKWIELLREMIPNARRIAVLFGASPASRETGTITEMRAAAQHLGAGITIEQYSISDAAELPSTFATMLRTKPGALVVDNTPLLASIARGSSPSPTACRRSAAVLEFDPETAIDRPAPSCGLIAGS